MGDFKLGVVVVEVTTHDGRTTIEDWAPEDVDQARDYAAETSRCSDVTSTVFRHGGEVVTFGSKEVRNG